MAEATLNDGCTFGEFRTRRLMTRFKPSEGLVARVDSYPNKSANVRDLSMGGCCIETSVPKAINERVHVQFFKGTANLSSDLEATVRNSNKISSDRFRHNVQFKEQKSLEEARALVIDLAYPLRSPADDQKRVERQTALAFQDLRQLGARAREIQGRLVTVVLTTLTLSIATAGLFFTLLAYLERPSNPGNLNLWFLMIAIAPGAIGLFGVTTMIEKLGELRRYGAFSMILQRCLCIGNMPPMYRGWEDAFANYNRRWKSTAHQKRSDLPVPVKWWKRPFSRGWAPADIFYLLATILFLVVMPLISLVMM